MKALILLPVVIATFLSPAVYAETVKKVSPEKIRNMTPEQRERFSQAGRDAQRASEESRKDYNEVEKGATKGKETSEKIRDAAVDILKSSTGIQ